MNCVLRILALCSVAAVAVACVAAQTKEEEEMIVRRIDGQKMHFASADRGEAERIGAFLREGRKIVKKFFGRGLRDRFEVRIFPGRRAMTEFWRTDWKVPDLETECWMVASGTASKLTILSPRVWKSEACEHDPADTEDTRLVVIHELVHVYHGQMAPDPNFEGMDEIGWFAEGLATYVSGQLSAGKMATARDAVEKGREPKELKNAWSGRYRYGISGSIVKYIDMKYGRRMLTELLGVANEKELLGKLGTSGPELLAGWRAFVLAG